MDPFIIVTLFVLSMLIPNIVLVIIVKSKKRKKLD